MRRTGVNRGETKGKEAAWCRTVGEGHYDVCRLLMTPTSVQLLCTLCWGRSSKWSGSFWVSPVLVPKSSKSFIHTLRGSCPCPYHLKIWDKEELQYQYESLDFILKACGCLENGGWARQFISVFLREQFSDFCYKFNSYSLCKNAELHLSPLYPLFDLELSGEDVHRTLKLLGVNRGSTCEETERSYQSKNNCISQQGSGKEYVVLPSGAPFSLKKRREKCHWDTEGSSRLPPVQ